MIMNPPTRDINEQWCFVFDIDSTIADNSHRSHFLQDKTLSPAQKWDAFQNPVLVLKDTMSTEIKNPLNKLMLWPNAHIVFLTGRPDKLYNTTLLWLHSHIPNIKLCGQPTATWQLVCKPKGSPPTNQWKSQWISENRYIIQPSGHSIIIVDDAIENLKAILEKEAEDDRNPIPCECYLPTRAFWTWLNYWIVGHNRKSLTIASSYQVPHQMTLQQCQLLLGNQINKII